MSILTVSEVQGQLVVDSRLIAQDLGVEHESFMRTVKKYERKIEQRFGILRFEIGTSQPNANGAVHQTKFAWLTEDQANALMTFSKNTDQVVECKLNLVAAFSKAKKIIREVIPAQNDRIREMELELELVRTKERYMNRREAIIGIHGLPMLALLDGRPDAVVEVRETVTETIVVKDGRQVSFEGKSTAEVGREYGFKTGKEFERWLTKVGRDDVICQGLRAVQAPYIPTENLDEIKQIWLKNKTSSRQMLIGE